MTVTTYQFGTAEKFAEPAPQQLTAPVAIRFGGATRSDGANTLARVNTADGGNGEEGILSTAKRDGRPVSADALLPTDRVTVGGIEMTVEGAQRAGLLKKKDDGYALADKEEEAAVEEDTDTAVAFSKAEDEAVLRDLGAGTMPSTQIRAVTELTEGGELNRVTLTAAATELGIHPDEVSARVETVVNAFRGQAAQFVTGLGCDDPEDFFAWAADNRPKEMQAAMKGHAMNRDTAGYSGVYQEYVANLADHNPDAILNAELAQGISIRKVDGKVLLTVQGREVEYGNAVRLGLVRVSKR